MKLSTSLIAVKKISSTIPRSKFSNEELEQAAQLILEAEGIINPIVVRRTSLQSYDVVEGGFEYYAAARAREIDSRKGEMIGAYIIEDENEEVIKEQIKLLRKPKPAPPEKENSGSDEARLTNFEVRVENRINELKAEQARDRQYLENEIKELKNQLPSRIQPLDVFNNMSLSELAFRLRSTGLTDKKAAEIAESVEKERQKKKFESLSDVVERVKVKNGKRLVKGVNGDKMVAIVDSWSRLLFS
ncbi:MAG: hypothetical protein KME06_03465 [Kastovskya adunca ATA6-11-RM4]|jgi:hypothetical protein|nr:hypothetical protein [Kastovskya adunca ATA6-11-RM4]